jgi:hypothetical protein
MPVHNRRRLCEIALFSGVEKECTAPGVSKRRGRVLEERWACLILEAFSCRMCSTCDRQQSDTLPEAFMTRNVCACSILLNQLVNCARHPARIFRVHDMPSAGGS